jgi:hypothetical protein
MEVDYEGYIKEKMQKNPITISPEASFFRRREGLMEKIIICSGSR